MAPTRRIDGNGRLVSSGGGGGTGTGDDDDTTSTTTTAGGPGYGSSCCTQILQSRSINCIPDSIDVFGFNISFGQLFIVQVLATLMLGWNGSLVFLGAIGGYALFQRITTGDGSSSSSSRSSSSNSNNWGSGSNIKGVKDLPKPPPSGG